MRHHDWRLIAECDSITTAATFSATGSMRTHAPPRRSIASIPTADSILGVSASTPLARVPKSSSGAGDLLGGDYLVTLGLWSQDNFVGTDFGVASTTAHEVGHGLGLWHGGAKATFEPVSVATAGESAQTRVLVRVEPNCKPNYLSVMSYLFQLRGLVDDTGVQNVNY